jgi:hypothetical protein
VTTATKRRLTWRAGADRVAHASAPKGLRTLCGERIVDERLAHPELRRCLGCRNLADQAAPR